MTPAIQDVSVADAVPSRTRITVSTETRLDLLYGALLVALTAVMLLPAALSLPMELWDESRNANNAMEIAIHGHWMVPTFGGVPDHWNTKPPLLIWIVAGLLHTGLDPMLAVRLPSVAATTGSVLLVYATCRSVLEDRLAGLLAGLLVVCSALYMGDHVGRNGDYDALLAFLSLGCVLCLGRYIDAPAGQSAGWIALGGLLLLLALMTKGVAAGMPLPGLLAYAILRRRFVPLLRDWRLWASTIGVIAAAAGWLALREQRDPGYLAAMWENDVGGRLVDVLEQHAEGPLFYPMVLLLTVEPIMLLLPTLLAVRADRDPARRRLCLLTVLTAASWIVALSCARTKIYWYIAPAVPLLAIAVAIGTTTYLRRSEPPVSSLVVIRPIVATLLIMFWYLNIRAPGADRGYAYDQVWYGAFLSEIHDKSLLDGAVILDLGLPNDAGFADYNPIARFFVEDAARHGTHIRIAAPGAPITGNATLITCDPRVRAWLRSQRFFSVRQSDTRCLLGRVATPAGSPAG